MHAAQDQLNRSIAERMRRRERIDDLIIKAKLVTGVPLSFVGPLVLASLVWLAMVRWSSSLAYSWLVIFGVLCVLMIPLLYWQENRMGDSYWDDTMSEVDVYRPHGGVIAAPGLGGGFAAAGFLIANRRATSASIVEIFLLGLRLVINALRRNHIRRMILNCNFDRATKSVAILFQHNRGTDSKQLLNSGESLDDLIPILAYLVYFRWIGTHSQWSRVWLTSNGRDELISHVGVPAG